MSDQNGTSNIVGESAPKLYQKFDSPLRLEMPPLIDRLGALLDETAWQKVEAQGQGASEFAHDTAKEELLISLITSLKVGHCLINEIDGLLDETVSQLAEARGQRVSKFAHDTAREEIHAALLEFLTKWHTGNVQIYQLDLAHAAEFFGLNFSPRTGEVFFDEE